jgi:pyrroline-5-carboxylate reductase
MKIAMIGCGVMGSAFARHFAKKHQVVLYDKNPEQSRLLAQEISGAISGSIQEVVSGADVVLLAFKPKDLATAAKAANGAFEKGQLVISILAGTPLSALKHRFPKSDVIRIMPNLALTCGQGVVGLVDDEDFSPELRAKVEALLEGMGLTIWMPENKIEALTALSASGIGLILLMLEAMIEGGIYMGFTSQEARKLVLKTVEGTIALLSQTGKHPAEIKLDISSPGGTTIAGLKEMEDRGVRSGIISALLVAYQQGQKMQE